MAIRLLKKGSTSSTSTETIYTVGIGNTASISSLVICNTSSSSVAVKIYISDSSDTLVTEVKLNAGVGKSKVVAEMIGGINSQSSVKMQLGSSGSVNYIIYGEVTRS